MSCQTHIIDICRRLAILRQSDRTIPETEVVHSVRALGHCKEGLAVSSLDAYYKNIFSVPLDGSGVECSVHAETLHQIRICLLIEVVAPEKRSVVTCKDRIRITLVNSVTFDRLILLCDEGFVLCLQPLQSFVEFHIVMYLFLY